MGLVHVGFSQTNIIFNAYVVLCMIAILASRPIGLTESDEEVPHYTARTISR